MQIDEDAAVVPVTAAVADGLRRLGLAAADEDIVGEPLAGGVSSDIWRVDLAGGPVCAKRALARLRVADEWTVPTTRSQSEHDWLQVAGAIVPGHVPAVIAGDGDVLVLEWLSPAQHRLWKADLLAGAVDVGVAAAVGTIVARVHAATAGDPSVAERFATDDLFRALRLDPYFGATAAAHPDLAAVLGRLDQRTASTRLALVHGDVSPKNILLGPGGPVLLDAECAWFGDPAFDVAFCLNHLLLKAVHRPDRADGYADAAAALFAAYVDGVDWEPAGDLELRVATLLPALLLARVDGKSPVEYLDGPSRSTVRVLARDLLVREPHAVATVIDAVVRASASDVDRGNG